ncbi:hypothetical protein CAEBREN_01370 [Caenorhabditis brenneri]|uniref:Uncharacterized protein n=1 Tax=Caenorhabditis brenneri TaxID=135651 RepID=G0NJ65_CAEBE|nr:hypothetical protein CAEBREN_01370 [Caenorhabditis brenneri]
MGGWIGRIWGGNEAEVAQVERKEPEWLLDLPIPVSNNYDYIILSYHSFYVVEIEINRSAYKIIDVNTSDGLKIFVHYIGDSERFRICELENTTAGSVARKILGKYLGGPDVKIRTLITKYNEPTGLLSKKIQPLTVNNLIIKNHQKSSRWLKSIKSIEVAEVVIHNRNTKILKHPLIRTAKELHIGCTSPDVFFKVFPKIENEFVVWIDYCRNQKNFMQLCSQLKAMGKRKRVFIKTTANFNIQYAKCLLKIEGAKNTVDRHGPLISVPMKNEDWEFAALFYPGYIALRVRSKDDEMMVCRGFVPKHLWIVFDQYMEIMAAERKQKADAAKSHGNEASSST